MLTNDSHVFWNVPSLLYKIVMFNEYDFTRANQQKANIKFYS